MFAILRKNLTLLFTNNNASYLSLSLRFFSSSKKRERGASPSPAILHLLLHKHQFSPKTALEVASALHRAKYPENADSVLSFLKESGFTNAHLEKLMKYKPRFLTARLEECIKPKIRVLRDWGICSDDIAKIISTCPVILELNSSSRVIPSLSKLKGLLGTKDAVVKILRSSSWFLITDLEKTLIPNIEFLKSCGVPMERILTLLFIDPRCMLLRPGVIRKSVDKADEMGANRSSKVFIYSVRVLSMQSCEAWKLKLQGLRNCGFSESDIRKMFASAPQVFSGSMEKLKRAKDVILATGKYDLSCIVRNPSSLSYSIEKRHKPRIQILENLESKNLIDHWPALSRVCCISDEMFFKRFVGPYFNDVGELYTEKATSDCTHSLPVKSPMANSKLVGH